MGYARGRGKILSSRADHLLRRLHTRTDPTVRDEPRGTNRIRYPGSPRCKRCGLGVGSSQRALSAVAKVISPLPGEYGRKAET